MPRTQKNPLNREAQNTRIWTESKSQLSHTRASHANTNVKSAWGSSEYSQLGSVFASHILKGFCYGAFRVFWTLISAAWGSASKGNYAFEFWQHRNFDTKNPFIVEKPKSAWSKLFCVDQELPITCHSASRGASEKKDSNKGSEQRKHFCKSWKTASENR